MISPYDPLDLEHEPFAAPQAGALLGADELGRDVLSRLIYGARVSMYVGLMSVIIGITIGTVIGILSAYVGGVLDLTIQRIVDALMAFPAIIMALGLTAALGPSINNIVAALVVILAPGAIRVIRSQVLSIKELDYTLAAQAIGARPWRIMLRHIMPNVIASYIVLSTITLGLAIIIEASLTFPGRWRFAGHTDVGRDADGRGAEVHPDGVVAGGVSRCGDIGGGVFGELPGRRFAGHAGSPVARPVGSKNNALHGPFHSEGASVCA